MSFKGRIATALYPIMDTLYLESFWFYVPNRLVWDNWHKFLGAQDDPGDSIDYTIPTITTSHAVAVGDLGHYMGLPLGLDATVTTTVSALPFRAYRLIWNDWFRNQNLDDSVTVITGDGPDTQTQSGYGDPPLKRRKRADYFTSCLPSPQKGDAVTLPLGTSAPVITSGTGAPSFENSGGTNRGGLQAAATTGDVSVTMAGGSLETLHWNAPELAADLSTATAANINDIRLAIQTQRLLERDARSGTRINETILAHFGVTVPDFRVQRPELLGIGRSVVNIRQVENNSGSDGTLGDLAAYGVVAGTHGFTKSFVEHGYVIGMVNLRGDISYSQGLERHWTLQTRYDHYYPVLSQLGEEAVLRQEIYHDAAGTGNSTVFGYQERYGWMRYKPGRNTGLFDPNAAGTLAAWHLQEDFGSAPALNSTFIEANTSTPLDRAIATPTEPHLIFDSWIDVKQARAMPLYGVPGNLDHL